MTAEHKKEYVNGGWDYMTRLITILIAIRVM
jgi:hypothetical protein